MARVKEQDRRLRLVRLSRILFNKRRGSPGSRGMIMDRVRVKEQQPRLWHLAITHSLQRVPRVSWLTRVIAMVSLEE